MTDPRHIPQVERSDDRPLYVLQGSVDADGNVTGATDTGDGEVYGVREGENSLVIQVAGNPSGLSLVPQASLDGESFHVVEAVNLSNGTRTTDISGVGLYQINISDLEDFKAVVSAITGGDVIVYARGSEV